VFGTGEQTRDYIHVADVVAALLAAEGSDDPGPLNVGTGVETSVLQLAELVGRAFGRDEFESRFAAAREGEVQRTFLDTTAAAERLGWRAERTIETGLEQTIEAIR
jgi:UDP-glucose 4-epimerase